MTPKANKPGCTGVYTWQKVKDDVLCLYEQKHSLRAVARVYGPPITHADIQRILKGLELHDPEKLLALGMPETKPAPVCRHCGEVHVSSRCPHRRRPYRTISEMPTSVLRWKLENREAMR